MAAAAAAAAPAAVGAGGVPAPARRELYPPIEPYKSGMLDVGNGHQMYWEECGNPEGIPAVFLHGGPGGGCNEKCRRFHDPAVYRIVLFDQRGSGKSLPFASLENNTTWHLVADIEKLRNHLGIDKWQVFGGSWGSTLALAYAQKHPERVMQLVLRGIFTLRRRELLFFYQDGGSFLYPDAWEPYLAHIPVAERGDMMAAYYKRLTDPDEAVRIAAAKPWSIWEGATSKLFPDPDFISHFGEDAFALAFARIECHYFVNAGWLREGQLISKEEVDKIRHIPTVIVQGRYDIVCPMETAYLLSKEMPEAKFVVVPDAGHSAFEPGIQTALLDATDSFRA